MFSRQRPARTVPRRVCGGAEPGTRSSADAIALHRRLASLRQARSRLGAGHNERSRDMRVPFLGMGVLLIVVGAIVLLGQTGALDASEILGDWWPLAIVWIAVMQLLSHPRSLVGPLLLALVGSRHPRYDRRRGRRVTGRHDHRRRLIASVGSSCGRRCAMVGGSSTARRDGLTRRIRRSRPGEPGGPVRVGVAHHACSERPRPT